MKRLIIILVVAVIATGVVTTRAEGAFAWGVDMGTSIDMTGNDMTSIDLSAAFGYKNSWINLMGVGAGINMAVADSRNTLPVFAIFRSSFRSRPSCAFFETRCGIAINNLPGNTRQTSAYVNPSVGFNLAGNDNFRSYITLGYVYNGLDSFGPEDNRTVISHGLSMVNMRIGITF